jgi:lysophospholipase L1-like esterase
MIMPSVLRSGTLSRFLLAAVLAPVLGTLAAAPPVATISQIETFQRVVFLGDSITYGGQFVEFFEVFARTRYPDWRGEILNLGLSSETVSGLSEDGHAGGKFPRPDLHERLERVLTKTKPDLVIACYGMNDGIYLPFSEERFQKFQNGMRRLHEQVTAAGAQIIHLTPPTFDPAPGNVAPPPLANYNDVLDRYAEWLLAQRAQGWTVLDLHGPMNRHLATEKQRDPAYKLAGDGVHPGETGHWLMALPLLLQFGAPTNLATMTDPIAWLAGHPRGAELLKLIHEKQVLLRDAWLSETGHKRPGVSKGLPLAAAQARATVLDEQIRRRFAATAETAPFPGQRTTWNGFDRYDFSAGQKLATVIVPTAPLPGKLWAWKGEFLDAFPGTEIALLKRGIYIVYLQTSDLLGGPEAVRHWNDGYRELTTKHGFAKRPALIALSRAGLYCYNWAATNPDQVACIYADAAVCDFKSWPGGKPKGLGQGQGSPRDWQLVLDCYGFESDAEAIAYKLNPVDNLASLAAAKVPLFHVYGDADEAVPWEENTGVIARRYRELGGDITLIGKPGVGHHPHGLADPTPVVEFIVERLKTANRP